MESACLPLSSPLRVINGMEPRTFEVHGLEVSTRKSDFGPFFEITVTLHDPVAAAFKSHKIQVSTRAALRAELTTLADRICQQLGVR